MSAESMVQIRELPADTPRPPKSGRTPQRGWFLRGCGELLITFGVLLVLFVVGQLWWTNIDADAAHREAVTQIAQELSSPAGDVAAGPEDSDDSSGAPTHSSGRPVPEANTGIDGDRVPIAEAPAYGQPLGIVYVPRFGADYARPLIEGTGNDVLDTLGLGHYTSTAMPGEVGNFAVAGHRQTNGKVLDLIHTLLPGDRIHVRTAEGYYTYVFRDSEIVRPTETRVLAPVPDSPSAQPTESLLTLTSCHPRFGSTERIIAYAVLESWRPVAAGPPADIADTVAAVEGRS